MMILLAGVFIIIAITTIMTVMLSDRKDEALDDTVQIMASAEFPIRRMPGKKHIRTYDKRRKIIASYAASANTKQVPELPESWSDYHLYQKHGNVEIRTVCDDDTINKLTVGQRVTLSVGHMDKKGFWDVIVSADGAVIGYLPASAVRKEILRKRDLQWHEIAYIDGINLNGRVTLLIGLYSLNDMTKKETNRRHGLFNHIKASQIKSA